MNPVFWFLVVVAAVGLWFVASKWFIWLGGLASNKLKEVSDILCYEEKEEKKEKEDGTN